MHAWTLTSNKNVFSAHLRIDQPNRAATLLAEAHDLLRNRFGFHFSTVQIETKCLDEDHAKDLDISALLRLPKPVRTGKGRARRKMPSA
jgi:cobalt-zinc-cadmium efflux system protein